MPNANHGLTRAQAIAINTAQLAATLLVSWLIYTGN